MPYVSDYTSVNSRFTNADVICIIRYPSIIELVQNLVAYSSTQLKSICTIVMELQ